VVPVGSSGQSRSSADIVLPLLPLRASHISAQMLVIVIVAAPAADPVCVGEKEEEVVVLGALRGGALPLARSAAFLARCVAKVRSLAALKVTPASQAGSFVTAGAPGADVGGGGVGAGAFLVVVVVGVVVAVEGLEASLGAILGMVRDCVRVARDAGVWSGYVYIYIYVCGLDRQR